jgi:Cu(I)/Ag(I) efflux system membrane fusion protein
MLSLPVRFILLLVFLAFTASGTAILSAGETLPPLPDLPPLQDPALNTPPAPELWAELPPLQALEEESVEEIHTIWTCSMHPNIQLPEFGQCPICFMDLIEVALDSSAKLTNLRQVTLNDNARKLAQVEVTPVVRRAAATSVRMVGKVDFDETLVSSITAWINGRIDKLHVAYTGSQVHAGQPMAEIYSPEILAAQAELIEAVAAAGKLNGSDNLLLRQTINRTESAARKKLQLLGLTSEQIDEVIARKNTSDHVTLTAPISGIVINKEVTEGMYVKTGAPIYTIADFSKLWIILEAYESDLHGIRMNQLVDFSAEAFPGTQFTGRIAYIDPVVNNKTRTVRIRLNIDNPGLLLKPGMFVRAVAKSSPAGVADTLPLLIPASAPLYTGKRAIVYVQLPDKEGVYEGREIILGPRHGEFYAVASGLGEGELVVTRGNFKIDSAIQIQARPSMMNPFIPKKTTDPAELPPLFSSKLNLLNETFVRLSQTVHAGDQKSQDHFLDSFDKILAGIQSDFFDPEFKLDWQELAMVLNSDIILLREAEDTEELLRTYAEMAAHFYQVRTRFQLIQPILAKEGSDELRLQLAKLLDQYLALQKNLADDAPEKSLADIRSIAVTAKSFITELTASNSVKDKALSTELDAAIQQLHTSTNIQELRTAFYPLSKVLIAAVSTFGVSGSYAVYEHYCPMAFDDTGANWLDTSETINNPYFGDEMLRCGEVLSQFKLEE